MTLDKSNRPAARRAGRWVVTAVALAAALAAAGTCARFRDDNPTSHEALVVGAREVEAHFSGPGVERIRPGMLAFYRPRGSGENLAGRVAGIRSDARFVTVLATFPEDLPQSNRDRPGILAIDVSLPPESLH